jgi:Transcription termination factor nusG
MRDAADKFWLIIRCAPAATLSSAAELRSKGFDVWTPIVEREYRKARSKKYIRHKEPLLSSYIFVEVGDDREQCAADIDDLRYTLGVRVMRHLGEYAGTSERSLEPLREMERDAETWGVDNLLKYDNLKLGQIGQVNAAAFGGLECKIVGRSRGNLILEITGSVVPVTVKPSLFVPASA